MLGGARIAKRDSRSGGQASCLTSSSSRRRPGSRASVYSCRDTAIWLACRGLPSSCRRPGYFLLLAQEKVTKEKGPPDDAPSGPSGPPGARVGSGVFRQGILPWRKTGPHPCGPPFGLSSTHPPRHTGTPESPEQCPEQQPRAVVRATDLLWERTLCATILRSDTSRRGGRAQGALLQDSADVPASTRPSPRPSPRRGEGQVGCIAKTSHGRCEASLRFKSSAIRARCAAH